MMKLGRIDEVFEALCNFESLPDDNELKEKVASGEITETQAIHILSKDLMYSSK